MKKSSLYACLLLSLSGSQANSQEIKVLSGPAPKWIAEPLAVGSASVEKDAILKILYSDQQVLVTKRGQDIYIAQRFKILKPEALQLSNLRFAWQPSNGSLTVHKITLHRADGTATEMLGKHQFQIVQAEGNLEQAVLSGISTAVFTVPGIEVGDELEFSATIHSSDQTLGDKAFGILQLPLIEIPGAFRVRVLQNSALPMRKSATPDLLLMSGAVRQTEKEMAAQLVDPKAANIPERAPDRYSLRRQVEYSNFTGWTDVSSTFWKHFDLASRLPENSPIRREIDKIAAKHSDPQARTLAALKLVQDRVRYVFVGLGTGNYTPATADETWERRYGDCKGKTALLLAILRELGISAEAVLVNSNGMSGTDQRLPSPGHFNHVLVRATIGSEKFWLDGTFFNSPSLAYLPQPVFRTALPLTSSGAELETVKSVLLERPRQIQLVDVDASAGPDKPSHMTVRYILNGSEATEFKSMLSMLAGDDLKRILRTLVDQDGSAVEGEISEWHVDEQTGTLNVKWEGILPLDWDRKEQGIERYYLPNSGFYEPSDFMRPKEQDQAAPWKIDFPTFDCAITTLKTPPDDAKTQWSFYGIGFKKTVAGTEYYRSVKGDSVTLQVVRSKRSLQPELTAQEAATVKAVLNNFDTTTVSAYRHKAGRYGVGTPLTDKLINTAEVDWLSSGEICSMSQK
jgi:hypothetical protein